MYSKLAVYLPAALFLAVVLFIACNPTFMQYLSEQALMGGVLSYVFFVLLLVIATVLMPVTVMPLIPAAAAIFGPLPTALLSIIGWTIGAVIAFVLARYVGRPLLRRVVSLEKLDAIIALIPDRHRFFAIVLLRLTIPVDIASYALGLTATIGLVEYTLATLLGVVWFSFAFAYLGDALLAGNMPILIEIGSASVLVFLGGWYMLRRMKSQR